MATVTSSTSSEDSEENKPKQRKYHSKSRKKDSKRCYMHSMSVQREDVVRDFTMIRWDTYRNSIKRWLPLQGESKEVAESYKHCVDVPFDQHPEDAGFHIACYNRFNDKKRFVAAEKSATQTLEVPDADAGQSVPSASTSADGATSETPRKKLRSRTGLPVASAGPVLPALCIICKKVDKYITVAGKRTKDQLSKAETLSAGRLMKAAEMKEDFTILRHIKDKDCVALEVRYHRICYRDYCRFLTRSTATSTATTDEVNQPPFTDSYKIFCERVIRQRLIVNQDVLKMNQLRKMFVNTVKEHEGLDASEYRQDKLKRRLTCDFPQLVFHKPAKRNVTELVYVETLAADKLIDRLPQASGTETTTESQSTEVSQDESHSEHMASTTSGHMDGTLTMGS